MDKLDEKEIETTNTKFKLKNLKDSIFNTKSERSKDERRGLVCDLLLFAIGFVLSRCHIFFGARPVGLAFVIMLPVRVLPTLVGVALGGITLGIDGLIFAAASVVSVLLRAAVSSGYKDENGRRLLFEESLLTRMAIAVLGGFVTAVYQVLLSGLNETSLLFGLTMIILTPILTFALSGIFSTGITLDNLISGRANLLSVSDCDRKEGYNKIFFQISSLLLIFLIGLSFKGVNIMGISATYIFSGVATLITAKRFGALRGAAVGFLSSLSVSASLSVSFALMGLGSGLLFSFGSIYAIIMGGIALCAFSIYSEKMTGLLSTLPEYLIASAIAVPFLNKINLTDTDDEAEEDASKESAEDMVGTMALAYQSRYNGKINSISSVLLQFSDVISEHFKTPIRLSKDEYREIVISVAEEHCIGCPAASFCAKTGIRPSINSADRISEMLCEGQKITPDQLKAEDSICQKAEIVAEEINIAAEREEHEQQLLCGGTNGGEEYRLVSNLISNLIAEDEGERRVDNSMTPSLNKAIESLEIKNGTIRAFGNRRKHFILAGEDENGSKVTSFELRKNIEKTAGVKLSTPEYFKRDKMMLMECTIRRQLKAAWATAGIACKRNQVSGDTSVCFESKNDYFYSLISDGMGSGGVARETSELVCDFIKASAEIGAAKDSLIHMLNHTLRQRLEECSATVDLFELDLLNGEGLFLKSGAAPSFVKRESSIFRIRSQTAPIGLLHSIDTEKIRLEIKKGDYIIMLSDGIADSSEDAPWLLLLLGEPPLANLQDYANLILNEAIKNKKSDDDMTVTVIRIEED